MKIIDKIVQQSFTPEDKSVLWDNGEDLLIYRNNKWEKVIKPMSSETAERIITALDKNGTSVIEFTQDSAKNLDIVGNLDLNTNYICNYKISEEEIIHGTYYNGRIMCFYNGKITEWNVNFDSGNIYIIRQIDPEFISSRVELNVASSGTPEAALNLERLRATLGGHFMCDIDHGFGVGTFQDTVGGYAHITTAYGDEAYYNILEDGSIELDETKKSLSDRIKALEEVLL